MRRIFQEQKSSSVALKEAKRDRKRLSSSINIDRKNFEDLGKELKKINLEIRILRKEKDILQRELSDLKNQIKANQEKSTELNKEISLKNEEAIELKIELEKSRIKEKVLMQKNDDELKENQLATKQLLEEISTLKTTKNSLEVENEKIIESRKNLSIVFISEEKNLKTLKDKIEEMNLDLTAASKKSQEYNVLKKQTEDLEKEKNTLEGTLIRIQEAIKLNEKELISLKEDKNLEIKTLNDKEKSLIVIEKRIQDLGETLQQHFDRHNIPIKVFK